jgi:hypothetical protein
VIALPAPPTETQRLQSLRIIGMRFALLDRT